MNKRFVSIMLALALMATLVLPVATETNETTAETTAPEQKELKVSDACVDMIKGYEGFSSKPYWDYAQWTVGYGTCCPADMLEYYKANGITRAEAEVLLRNHISGVERYLKTKIIEKYNVNMTQQQYDALVSFSYNVGSGWMTDSSSSFRQMVIDGVTDENYIIDRFTRWCHAGGSILTALVRRRLCEANVYINGEYVQIPPENYCYVRYDGNGGNISDDIQGFNSTLTAEILSTATRNGYQFKGWYNMAVGGTKVEVLDASIGNLTVFAQWESVGESGVVQPTEPVSVTVTGNSVNVRQGPGTNYSIMGQANKGDKLEIVAVANGGSYIWGQFSGGWICLDYTTYFDEPVQNPDETDPEETVPEETVPEETEPEETVPEETEPEEAKVMGTVKVSDVLRVRSGAGTGYGVVDTLKNGVRVEILEQKTVGAMVWGKISNGWISMDYVVLDKPTQTEPEVQQPVTPPATTTVSGTVDVSDTLRVRKGAGTSYGVAGYLKDGAKVEILEQKTVGGTVWGRISMGWISMDYVILDKDQEEKPSVPEQTEPEETEPEETEPEETEPEETVPEQTKVMGTVKVGDVLRVRTGAGTSYNVAGYLYNNERVEILETVTSGGITWGRTAKGWVSMAYIQLDKPASATISGTITADCLRVRSTAGSGSVVGYYYNGAKVEILETTTVGGVTWGRTDKGWISMQYVK